MNGAFPIEPAPFLRLGPDEPATPLVIAVPHAGRFYPPVLAGLRAVPHATLQALEDRYADRLVAPAVAAGAIAIVATHARAWIDLNRSDDEASGDGVANARSRAGLGLVPLRLGGRALWHAVPSMEQVAKRIARVHAPYHAAIAAALAAARARHGYALLLDCHSMPPLGAGNPRAARIVVGDRHGSTAAAAVSTAATAAVRAHGLVVARNTPYAGAYTIEHHARPQRNVDAIQVEIDRSLYLEAGLREPSRALGEIAALVAAIGWQATAAACPLTTALAAE